MSARRRHSNSTSDDRPVERATRRDWELAVELLVAWTIREPKDAARLIVGAEGDEGVTPGDFTYHRCIAAKAREYVADLMNRAERHHAYAQWIGFDLEAAVAEERAERARWKAELARRRFEDERVPA